MTKNISQAPEATVSDSCKLYSKITLLLEDKEVCSKKQNKCFQNEHILDFSQEHRFKIIKDDIEKYAIKIQIKRSQSFGVKSKYIELSIS